MAHTIRWILLFAALPLSGQFRPSAHALVDSAIATMGGPLITRLSSFRLDGVQHEYVVGNAERAEGPWRATYTRFSDLWDVAGDRIRRTATNPAAMPGTPAANEQVTIFTDSVLATQVNRRVTSAYPGFYEDYRDRIDAAPARVLLLAAAAPSLRWEKPVVRYGVPHDVVAFSTSDGPIRVEIDRDSHLPTAVELVRNYPWDFRRRIFGDVTTRIEYVDWTLQPSGIWWPMQHRFLLNGELFRDLTITTIANGVAAPPDSFAVADSTRSGFVRAIRSGPSYLKIGDHPDPAQPGDGIVRLADQWAMTLVKQDDGVVIFEAHLSDNWFKQVVAEAHRRWPGVPITAVVLTSDPWAHLGGVREAVAMGLPIYVNARSVPFLTALVKRSSTIRPDDLARAPKTARIIPVVGKTTIGTGTNRLELYPVGGAYAERMTMAYFPGRHLLYGADLVFPDRPPTGSTTARTFLATPASDLRHAVDREHLQVDSLFSVQAVYPVFAWKDFIHGGDQP